MILKLLAKLGLDKTGFDAGIDSAGKKAQKFGADLKTRLAGGFGAAAFVALARETIAYGDQLEELATRLNTTTQAAQEYALAAKMGGADTEFFAGKWALLQREMANADTAKNPFEVFGLGIEQLRQMNPDQVLRVMAAHIDRVGYSAKEAGAFMDIFGRGGGKMANVLKDLKSAKSMTAIFTDEEIAHLQRADDILVKLGNNAKVWFARALTSFASLKTQLSLIHPLIGALVPGRKLEPKPVFPDMPGAANEEEVKDQKERIRNMDLERYELEERTRRSKLKPEERLNEILQERAEIMRQLDEMKMDEEARSLRLLELAKLDAEAEDIKNRKPSGQFGPRIAESAFGRIGAFTGAAASAAIPPGTREQNETLKRIEGALVQKGIVVRDVQR